MRVRVHTYPTEEHILITERAKNAIIEYVNNSDERMNINFSTYISKKVGIPYYLISKHFIKIHGTCIQDFIISTKIDKAKEFIHEGKSATEIYLMLDYSSLPHLSRQFKNITGITISEYIESINNTANT